VNLSPAKRIVETKETNMNCEECRTYSLEMRDRTLPDAVARQVRLHLAHCSDCRRRFQGDAAFHDALFQRLNEGGPARLPPALADDFIRRLGAARPAPALRLRLPRVALALAASLLVCIALAATVEAINAKQKAKSAIAISYEPSAISHSPSAISSSSPAISQSPSAISYSPPPSAVITDQQSEIVQTKDPAMNTFTNTIAAAATAVTISSAAAGYQPSATNYQPPATSQSAAAGTGPAWTYNSTAKTLTDSVNNWVLTATNVGNDVFVTGFKSCTDATGTLDFSGGISGGYSLVQFNDQSLISAAGQIDTLILPDSLVAVGNYAFRYCYALRRIVCSSPNLKTIGTGAIERAAITNDAREAIPAGVEYLGNGFITSMVGTLLLTNAVTINMTFGSCLLTNIVIDSPRLTTLATLPLTNYGAPSVLCTNLLALSVSAPALTSFTTSFDGDTYLRELRLDLPNVTSFTKDAQFRSMLGVTTDIARIIGPQASVLSGTQVFQNNPCTGALVLTNLTKFGNSTFLACPLLQELRFAGPIQTIGNVFNSCTAITNVELALPALTNLTATFSGCTSLSNLTIGATNLMTVSSFSFNNSPLRSVTFWGPMPPAAALDNILYNVADTTKSCDHACVIYASQHQTGWKDYWLAHPVSDAETATNKLPANCRGVYVTAANVRKAWIVEQESPYDGIRYFYIRVR